ncbi:MAG: hypothetical protein JWO79_2519 [Actinomycetia bacterium]|jgi:hypothetical protein|nr:hypothetical protein [Actinomycetes bacterium]MDQ1645498.1 hypothetical protein [Cryptosporangiaceae bacterium]MDQ1658754.1 hypothetical protein [Cryptosporangiaceae bacterium]
MCGAPVQGQGLEGVDVTKETVIQGVVTSGGAPVPSAYVRLLDGTGEFTAEVQTSATGQFRFFAAPGEWTLRALSRQGNGETTVAVAQGVNETELALA